MSKPLPPRTPSRRVVLVLPEDRKVIRHAAHLIGEAAGELRASMTLPPKFLGGPREWPSATHEDLMAKRDFDDAMSTHKALMRIANRRPK